MKKEFLKREWKYLLLLILIFITTIYAPRDYLDVIRILVFIVYSVVIYKFFGGYGGDYDSDRSIKDKIFEFVTIPKIIIFIIFLIALDLYSNDAEVISYLLNAYTCRGLDEGLPSVASGCYELGPREN
jgi:hypothetical protein|tara:strand:- start:56 stop:439 length:384 start_codon:yes stop_codon:yes gene_type:complete